MRIRTQVTHLQILKHTVAHYFQKGRSIPGFWNISICLNHYCLKCNKSKIKKYLLSSNTLFLQLPFLLKPTEQSFITRVSLAGVLFALREPSLLSLITMAPEDTQLELSASRGLDSCEIFCSYFDCAVYS